MGTEAEAVRRHCLLACFLWLIDHASLDNPGLSMGTPQVGQTFPYQSLIMKLPYGTGYGKYQLQVIATNVPSSQMTLAASS